MIECERIISDRATENLANKMTEIMLREDFEQIDINMIHTLINLANQELSHD